MFVTVPKTSIALLCALTFACSDAEPTTPSTSAGAATPGDDGASATERPPSTPPSSTAPAATAGDEGAASSSSGGEAQGDDLALDPGVPAPSGADPGSDGPSPAASPPPTQLELPELPSVRQEHAVVALGDEIYVIGGFTPNVTATVEAFNPASETWRSVADFPVALHHANAAAIAGRLYVAGFYLGASFTDADPRVFEYDPAADTWTPRAPMPAGTERASACVATFDGRMYLFGGARAGSVTDASVYDVASDTWRALPPLPEPREHCLAGEIDGTLIIASGRSGGIGGFEANTWAFDPAAEAYTARAAIPTPRGGTAGAVLGGRLYVFGGEGNVAHPSGVFPQIEAYDPATDTWAALPDMEGPRHGFGAAALGDSIYLPGGAVTQGFGAVAAHSVIVFDAPAP